MTHPLVQQLHFARSEFLRCLEGVSEEDGRRRLLPMNCISWIVGHLAAQEQWLWVEAAQGEIVTLSVYELTGHGRPVSTPSLAEMWEAWHAITTAADRYLNTVTTDNLQTFLAADGRKLPESVGTLLHRNIYHYWFHTGEAHAIRQQLGHPNLPEFVGNMKTAVYTPE